MKKIHFDEPKMGNDQIRMRCEYLGKSPQFMETSNAETIFLDAEQTQIMEEMTSNTKSPCRVDFTIGFDYESEMRKMRERKIQRIQRNEAKYVANITVTPNQEQEYDIDDVIKKLEECGTKPKKKKKKKVKKDKESKSSDKQAVKSHCSHDNQEKGIEPMTVPDQLAIEEPNPNIDQNLPIDQQSPDLPSGLECSTCFEPRIRTFALLPCGHATFCENCAIYFCESPDKRCPTCRAMTTGKVRLFL